MLLLICYNYDQYNIILIISFVITMHQLVAKLIDRYSILWSNIKVISRYFMMDNFLSKKYRKPLSSLFQN